MTKKDKKEYKVVPILDMEAFLKRPIYYPPYVPLIITHITGSSKP